MMSDNHESPILKIWRFIYNTHFGWNWDGLLMASSTADSFGRMIICWWGLQRYFTCPYLGTLGTLGYLGFLYSKGTLAEAIGETPGPAIPMSMSTYFIGLGGSQHHSFALSWPSCFFFNPGVPASKFPWTSTLVGFHPKLYPCLGGVINSFLQSSDVEEVLWVSEMKSTLATTMQWWPPPFRLLWVVQNR